MTEEISTANATARRHPTVVTEVAVHSLCIGCGTCAAICPAKRLEMGWTDRGTIQVDETVKECVPGCGRCLKVCPFGDSPTEDAIAEKLFGGVPGIHHRWECGYCLKCFAGFSKQDQQRMNGSSGGLTTWMLSELLRSGRVDHVVCVTEARCGGRPLFKYVICDTAEQVAAGGKSAYYPVEMSAVIRAIIERDGRYAIVGLPCFVKAIRAACEADVRLRKRITFVAGIACGHGASAYFTEFCAALAGVAEPQKLSRARFREKDPDQPATNFKISFLEGQTAGVPSDVHWWQGPGEAWFNWWFTPKSCLYCDDVFAEGADVVLLDAWLPNYAKDYRGRNLLIVRSPQALELLEGGAAAGVIELEEKSVDRVLRSQALVIRQKKSGIRYRLWLAERAGEKAPKRRVSPRRAWLPWNQWDWKRLVRDVARGNRWWNEHGRGPAAAAGMRRHMRGSGLKAIIDRYMRIFGAVTARLRWR